MTDWMELAERGEVETGRLRFVNRVTLEHPEGRRVLQQEMLVTRLPGPAERKWRDVPLVKED